MTDRRFAEANQGRRHPQSFEFGFQATATAVSIRNYQPEGRMGGINNVTRKVCPFPAWRIEPIVQAGCCRYGLLFLCGVCPGWRGLYPVIAPLKRVRRQRYSAPSLPGINAFPPHLNAAEPEPANALQ